MCKRICDSREQFLYILKTTDGVISDFDFSNLPLNNLDIEERIFENCRFEKTCFDDTNLDAAKFRNCDLMNASFRRTFMECAYFLNCKCWDTDFSKAHLMASSIIESDWTRADVSGANLLEIQASDWIIDEMVIDENTAVNDGEFENVDWSVLDVSKLNISLGQVKYFLQCANGGKYLQVYEDYKISAVEKRENTILQELWNTYEENILVMDKISVRNDLIFFSYASEQEEFVKEIYALVKKKHQVWMDLELKKDLKLNKQIEQVILSCGMAVIFLTKEYIVKAWTRYEFGRLLQEIEKRQLKIIVVNYLEENLKKEWISAMPKEQIIYVESKEELLKYLGTC